MLIDLFSEKVLLSTKMVQHGYAKYKVYYIFSCPYHKSNYHHFVKYKFYEGVLYAYL